VGTVHIIERSKHRDSLHVLLETETLVDRLDFGIDTSCQSGTDLHSEEKQREICAMSLLVEEESSREEKAAGALPPFSKERTALPPAPSRQETPKEESKPPPWWLLLRLFYSEMLMVLSAILAT
jgi:hypothetical protein